MTTETVKTIAITNLDAVPQVFNSVGEGAAGNMRAIGGTCPVTSGVTSGSIYKLARVPSNAKVKRVFAWLDVASTTITGDIGLYFSDAANDGTKPANQGVVVNADHFGSAVALAAIVTPTDYTSEAGTYLGADRDKPLWNTSASGLTVEPGGFMDVCLTLTSTAGAAAQVNVLVEYVE